MLFTKIYCIPHVLHIVFGRVKNVLRIKDFERVEMGDVHFGLFDVPFYLFILKNYSILMFQIIEALNKGEIPSTGSLVEVFNKKIIERCLKSYNERMSVLSLPLSEESLKKAHEISKDAAMKAFDQQHFGRNHAKKSVEQLGEEIEKVHVSGRTVIIASIVSRNVEMACSNSK